MAATTDYTDLVTLQKTADLDPELAEILKTWTPPPQNPDINVGRAQSLEMDKKRAAAVRSDAVEESTREVPMRDGFLSEVRVFTPTEKSGGRRPIVILYFGGGFLFGSNYQLSNYANFFSALFSAVVVLPAYRLAPENPFPAGPNDAWDTFAWVAANAASLGADPAAGFVVGGISAGANLTSVVVQKAVAEGFSPKVTGMWLSIPAVLSEGNVPAAEKHLWISREQNANAPGFNTEAITMIMGAYRPEELSPQFSPFNAASPHKGMPAAYVQVCGMDPLRDDGVIYERVLRQNGVKTEMDMYPGVPHGHIVSFPGIKSSSKFHVDAVVGVGNLLGKKVDRASVEGIVAKAGAMLGSA